MAIGLSIEVKGLKALERRLRVKAPRRVDFATKRGLDAAAKELKAELYRQWLRTMTVRRRSFPRNVLVVKRSYVRGGRVVRPAGVRSVGGDEALRAQARGAVRHPKGDVFRIPLGNARRLKPTGNYYANAGVLYEVRKRGPDRAVAVLAKSIRVPRRWPVARAVRDVNRRLPGIMAKRLAAELERVT